MATLKTQDTSKIYLGTSRRAKEKRLSDLTKFKLVMAEENIENSDLGHPAGPPPTLPRFYGQIPGSNLGPRARRTWTELVGLTVEEAQNKIKEEMPGAQIQVVPPGHFVTMDFRTNRVRIHVDSSGKVAREPMIG